MAITYKNIAILLAINYMHTKFNSHENVIYFFERKFQTFSEVF